MKRLAVVVTEPGTLWVWSVLSGLNLGQKSMFVIY